MDSLFDEPCCTTQLFYTTCKEGRDEDVRHLLQKHADAASSFVNAQRLGFYGDSPVIACCRLGHDEVLALLLTNEVCKADANLANSQDQTPMMVAAEAGKAACVSLLIAHGGDVNKANSQGQTPLFFATRNKHEEVASLLRTNGASLSSTEASQLFFPLCKEGRVEDVRRLLQEHADVASTFVNTREPDYTGDTPIIAC